METKGNNHDVREIDMDDLRNDRELNGLLDYLDGDIVIADDFSKLPYKFDAGVHVNMFLIIVCVRGKLQVDADNRTFVLHPNDLFFCHPNILFYNTCVSPDFEGKIVGFSTRVLQQFWFNSKDLWNKILYIKENPILHLDERGQKLFYHYYELVKLKLSMPTSIYHKEIMHSLLQAGLYEVLLDLDTLELSGGDNQMKQGDILFKNFLDLLRQAQGKERTVAYFANLLCVTPKHLSYACKVASQKTALKWIHDSVTENIRYFLLHSDKSIKEISNELNFPNLSFFGKYVRAHLGMSPREVRRTI